MHFHCSGSLSFLKGSSLWEIDGRWKWRWRLDRVDLRHSWESPTTLQHEQIRRRHARGFRRRSGWLLSLWLSIAAKQGNADWVFLQKHQSCSLAHQSTDRRGETWAQKVFPQAQQVDLEAAQCTYGATEPVCQLEATWRFQRGKYDVVGLHRPHTLEPEPDHKRHSYGVLQRHTLDAVQTDRWERKPGRNH